MNDLQTMVIAVNKTFNTDIEKITRKIDVMQLRQILHHIARRNTSHSLNEIAFFIGKKNHATVINSIKVVDSLLYGAKFRREYDRVYKVVCKYVRLKPSKTVKCESIIVEHKARIHALKVSLTINSDLIHQWNKRLKFAENYLYNLNNENMFKKQKLI